MLTLDEAKALALKSAREVVANKSTELAVFDKNTVVKPYGWLLIVNTRALLESGDFLRDALVGLGYIVVRHNGKVHVLSAVESTPEGIAAFERKHWLRG